MLLKMEDGKVVFATHFLRCAVARDDEQTKQVLAPYQLEADGVVCYSETEAAAAKAALDRLGIPYTLEPQTIDPALVAKAQNVVYASRSEALAHLLENKEPESLRLPNIINENTALKQRLKNTEDALLTLMFKGAS